MATVVDIEAWKADRFAAEVAASKSRHPSQVRIGTATGVVVIPVRSDSERGDA